MLWFSDQYLLGNQLVVDGVPVYVLLVPVHILPVSEECLYLFQVLLSGYDEDMLAFFKYGLGSRDDHLFILPYPRYDEMTFGTLAHILDASSEDGRVADLILADEGVVGRGVSRAALSFRSKEGSEDHDANDHAHKAERITYGTGHSYAVGRFRIGRVDLEYCLLCGSEHGSVGYRSGGSSFL